MVKIVWDIPAKKSFQKQIKRIKRDSPKNAENVRKDIFILLEEIPANPGKYPPDKFKVKNDGNYRAFEKHSLRIAYYVAESEIRILRVKHVRQEPEPY